MSADRDCRHVNRKRSLTGPNESAAASTFKGTAPQFELRDASGKSQSSKFGTGIETDEKRLENRAKQILFGKNTIGYDNYLAAVPKQRRIRKNSKHPTTPDIHEECSKRQFDGRIRAWRRMLHLWDNVDSVPSLCEEISKEASSNSKSLETSSHPSTGPTSSSHRNERQSNNNDKISKHRNAYNRIANEVNSKKDDEEESKAENKISETQSNKRRKVDIAEEISVHDEEIADRLFADGEKEFEEEMLTIHRMETDTGDDDDEDVL